MCSFHMTSDHDERECPDWLNCVQLTRNALMAEQTIEKEGSEKGETGSYFLEYDSDSERGGDVYTTLQEPACTVMTRGQWNQKPYPGNTPTVPISKGKEHIHADLTKLTEPKILSRAEPKASTSAFDIVEFCKNSSITISPAEYLKLNPRELDRLVQYVKGSSVTNAHVADEVPEDSRNIDEPIFVSERGTQNAEATVNSVQKETEEKKPNPFYISLLLNGQKLSNCIIDSGASDNIMPQSVAKALGLELTRTFGCCYAMDGKQVPLVGQVKDVQAVLYACPEKGVKLTILVADILASYGMLLSRTFCKEMGGEIKMDWSEAYIPVGKRKVKLEPELKNKYTVVPSDNPKAQILYEECQFGNYIILPEKPREGDLVSSEEALWVLEFDGSCSNLGSGAGVVLISPSGEIFPFSFKLDF